MDREQKIAFIQAMTISALAEIEGMKAANLERINQGYALAYDEKSFMEVPVKFGITHNHVIEFFQD